MSPELDEVWPSPIISALSSKSFTRLLISLIVGLLNDDDDNSLSVALLQALTKSVLRSFNVNVADDISDGMDDNNKVVAGVVVDVISDRALLLCWVNAEAYPINETKNSNFIVL